MTLKREKSQEEDGDSNNSTSIENVDGIRKVLCFFFLRLSVHHRKETSCDYGTSRGSTFKSDRFGTNFNVLGANIFNSFINSTGLEEVHLGGSAFTWCHKHHLDRFYPITRRFYSRAPNDYGPVTFRFFHPFGFISWALDLSTSNWNSAPSVVSNAGICVILAGLLMSNKNFFLAFQDRFAKPSERRANIDMRFPKTISEDQSQDLEREVSKQEIKTAVWGCGTDKSPGPDGFSFGFYRHFWPVIEHDVYMAVNHFFIHGEIPPGCNSSFIALILKVPDANLVKDFRPISLIGSIYNRSIAKILSNRLVNVLGDIVNEVQSAFIAERQMLDGIAKPLAIFDLVRAFPIAMPPVVSDVVVAAAVEDCSGYFSANVEFVHGCNHMMADIVGVNSNDSAPAYQRQKKQF
ncbi:hypothetical protein Tco_0365438 [Tanacetum coccineum]